MLLLKKVKNSSKLDNIKKDKKLETTKGLLRSFCLTCGKSVLSSIEKLRNTCIACRDVKETNL